MKKLKKKMSQGESKWLNAECVTEEATETMICGAEIALQSWTWLTYQLLWQVFTEHLLPSPLHPGISIQLWRHKSAAHLSGDSEASI